MAAFDGAVSAFFFEQRDFEAGGVGDGCFAGVTKALLHVTDIVRSIHRQPLRPRAKLFDLRARLLVADFVFHVAADAFDAAVA